MKALTIVASLSTLGVAQLLPISEIEALSTPPSVSAPNGVGAGSDVVSYDSQAVSGSTYANVYSSNPGASSASSKLKRLARRTDIECSALPLGSGPVPDPDTEAAFLADTELSSTAENAPTPDGWVNVFTNLQGATQSPMGYLGYDSLNSYDTEKCAANCVAIDGCRAINIYFERDPVMIPGADCPDPDSTTIIKCVYWGTTIGPDTATNTGQWQTDFEVAVAGSNGYVLQSTDDVPGYTGTFVNNGAINAPTDCNSYIQYEIWNDGQPFDPNRCAAACAAVTQFNADHLCSRATCRFFDTYILLKNGVPQGQVCAMYTRSWDSSYANNYGYTSTDGSDQYTIEWSYIYSNTTDPGSDICDSTCMSQDPCPSCPSSSTTTSLTTSTSTTSSTSSTGVTTTTSSGSNSTWGTWPTTSGSVTTSSSSSSLSTTPVVPTTSSSSSSTTPVAPTTSSSSLSTTSVTPTTSASSSWPTTSSSSSSSTTPVAPTTSSSSSSTTSVTPTTSSSSSSSTTPVAPTTTSSSSSWPTTSSSSSSTTPVVPTSSSSSSSTTSVAPTTSSSSTTPVAPTTTSSSSSWPTTSSSSSSSTTPVVPTTSSSSSSTTPVVPTTSSSSSPTTTPVAPTTTSSSTSPTTPVVPTTSSKTTTSDHHGWGPWPTTDRSPHSSTPCESSRTHVRTTTSSTTFPWHHHQPSSWTTSTKPSTTKSSSKTTTTTTSTRGRQPTSEPGWNPWEPWHDHVPTTTKSTPSPTPNQWNNWGWW